MIKTCFGGFIKFKQGNGKTKDSIIQLKNMNAPPPPAFLLRSKIVAPLNFFKYNNYNYSENSHLSKYHRFLASVKIASNYFEQFKLFWHCSKIAFKYYVSPASGSECCWCPDQRYRAASFVSSSEVQHASVAGQSGHARNCLAMLLNAWPPLPHHHGKTATSRL